MQLFRIACEKLLSHIDRDACRSYVYTLAAWWVSLVWVEVEKRALVHHLGVFRVEVLKALISRCIGPFWLVWVPKLQLVQLNRNLIPYWAEGAHWSSLKKSITPISDNDTGHKGATLSHKIWSVCFSLLILLCLSTLLLYLAVVVCFEKILSWISNFLFNLNWHTLFSM